MPLAPNLWKQKSSGTIFSFAGEDRDDNDVPFAVMKAGELTLRVDPLEMVKIDGDWEKL